MNPLTDLSDERLKALMSAFSHGSLKATVTMQGLVSAGLEAQRAEEILEFFTSRELDSNFANTLIKTVLETRKNTEKALFNQSLVVTGPKADDSHNLQTESRFEQVVNHAQKELLLGTFAIYQGDQVLAPIHEAMVRNPNLAVTLVVNVGRTYRDTTDSKDIIASYRHEFFSKHWCWKPVPEVYFFPNSLLLDHKTKGAMHAKFVVADEERCFITSANFTKAAQTRNIEIGVELRDSLEARQLSQYFKKLINEESLVRL